MDNETAFNYRLKKDGGPGCVSCSWFHGRLPGSTGLNCKYFSPLPFHDLGVCDRYRAIMPGKPNFGQQIPNDNNTIPEADGRPAAAQRVTVRDFAELCFNYCKFGQIEIPERWAHCDQCPLNKIQIEWRKTKHE